MKGCSQCQAMMINGIFCHETGCPNKNYRPKVRKPKAAKPVDKLASLPNDELHRELFKSMGKV